MVLMAVVVIMVVFMLVLDWLIPTRLDRHLTQRGVVLAEALRRGLKRPRHAAMSRQQLKERKYLQRLMGPIAGLFYLADSIVQLRRSPLHRDNLLAKCRQSRRQRNPARQRLKRMPRNGNKEMINPV